MSSAHFLACHVIKDQGTKVCVQSRIESEQPIFVGQNKGRVLPQATIQDQNWRCMPYASSGDKAHYCRAFICRSRNISKAYHIRCTADPRLNFLRCHPISWHYHTRRVLLIGQIISDETIPDEVEPPPFQLLAGTELIAVGVHHEHQLKFDSPGIFFWFTFTD